MDKKNSEIKKGVINRSISFDPETLDYLDKISKQEHRKRSAMIRVLIREYMQANFRATATH